MTIYNVLTLFPEMFESVSGSSIWARAQKSGLVKVNAVDIRGYTTDKHRRADDYPFGGEAGMVLMMVAFDLSSNAISRVRYFLILSNSSISARNGALSPR